MKCDENGGCPFGVEVRGEHQCWVTPSFVKRCNDELRYKRCHLTPADFPILDAMIAGEWQCENCLYRLDSYCDVIQDIIPTPDFCCNFWELTKETT